MPPCFAPSVHTLPTDVGAGCCCVAQTGLGYGKLLHGEAVAIGMHMAADMSCRLGWIERGLVDRTVDLMVKAGLPVELPAGGGMDMDKFLNVRSEEPSKSKP